MEAKTMDEVLTTLVGKIVTVVNPESYIRTLTGFTIDKETYNGKVISYEEGTLKLFIEYIYDPHKKIKEKMFEFIHIDHIKRVAISKPERLIFL